MNPEGGGEVGEKMENDETASYFVLADLCCPLLDNTVFCVVSSFQCNMAILGGNKNK